MFYWLTATKGCWPITSYVTWSLVLFAVVSLWGVAMSQIGGHLRQGVFPDARLATMAATISVVAVVTIIAASAAFFGAPSLASNSTEGPLAEPACPAEVRGAFVFSFGLEQGSRTISHCPARGSGG